jgi:hypothetical protein
MLSESKQLQIQEYEGCGNSVDIVLRTEYFVTKYNANLVICKAGLLWVVHTLVEGGIAQWYGAGLRVG